MSVRDRKPVLPATEPRELNGTLTGSSEKEHPLGAPKHGLPMQALRIVAFTIYFFGSAICIHLAQLLGAPLYFFSEDWFYAWMAMTKQHFGILITSMTYFWSQTIVRVSGDKSMAGLFKQDADGLLQSDFGERVVLIANHQLYTDWLYFWWFAYTNSPPMHGHIYIILKESLKWTPLIGPAMQFYKFIFMARRWEQDQARMRYRLQKLKTRHSGPMSGHVGSAELDPMWLLIFPEGTNLTDKERAASQKYSAKSGIPDNKHQLLPRVTGLQFCLQELKGTVEYLYDCTVGYEPIPPGGYGSSIFTLRSVYFQGRPPKSVNMHWRRYKVSDLPLEDKDQMYEWLLQRWREKDELLETFYKTGKFPADPSAVQIEGGPTEKGLKTAYINTEVRTRSHLEFLQIFLPIAGAGAIGRVLVQILDRIFGK